MPFTFKLSVRLALMKASCVVVAATACEVPDKRGTGPTPPGSAATEVVTSPDTVTLDPFQQRQFLAFGRTQAGDSVAVAVQWAASGGTITSGGLYTAGTDPGTYEVTATGATATTSTLAGRSHVKNRGPLAQVIVTPASATTSVGGTLQFAAYGRRTNGDSVAVSVLWAATGGGISAAGLFTAGPSAGTHRVIATQTGGTLADTGTVTVTAPLANPGTVTDLAVTGVTDSSVTLSFTEVSDGTGLPASYFVRFAAAPLVWASATDVAQGSCRVPLAGTAIGALRSCTVLGLAASTSYQFQLVAFRGTLGASAVFGALSNLATGTTAPSVAPVVSVTVSPASGTVTVGQTLQLVATPRDANGNPLSGRVMTWATSNGAVATVSGSGLVTGVVPGTAAITATSEGKSGSAAITVTAGSGVGVLLLQEGFEDNAFAARGWYDNTSLATTTAQHLPGGTRALEARFPVGATTPTWGGAARHLFQPTPTLYVSYWVKYSSNWVGSGRSYHPHEFMVLSDLDSDYNGLSNGWLVSYIEHNYQNGGIPRLHLQDNKAINTSYGTPPINLVNLTENRSTAGCNGVVETNVTTTCFNMPPWYNGKEVSASRVWFQPTAGSPGYKGDWNHVEVYFELNSVVGGKGVADGVMQYWFNGALVIDRHDILFRTGARPTIQFRQFVIAPYIGDGSPVDQTMWVDDLIVATARP